MIKTISLLGLLLVSTLASAVEVTTPSGKISVQLPADFTPLDRKEIELKFGRNGQLPAAVYGNKSRTATTAFTWIKTEGGGMSGDELPQLKSQMEDGMNGQIAGIKWLVKDIRPLNGKRWIYLENIAPARDTKIHNRIYSTDLNGNLLIVNFNVIESEFFHYAKSFGEAEKSLQAK